MNKFDAVKTVREIRDSIYEETIDKSVDELIAYYQSKLEQTNSVKENKTEYHS
jgi:hypothetical protein